MDNTMMINLLSRAAVLLLLLPVHEYAHARVSYALGDPTAANDGRLDLNPLVHLDPVGSLLMLLVGIGWAKPVPVDPRYYKNPRRDMVITAMAGPLANLIMGFLFLILAQVSLGFWVRGYYNGANVDTLYYMVLILQTIASISVSLAVFNLLPVPPLDGWKMMGAVLPGRTYWKIMSKEREIGMIFMLLILFTPVIDLPISFVGNAISDLFVSATAFVPRLMQAIL